MSDPRAYCGAFAIGWHALCFLGACMLLGGKIYVSGGQARAAATCSGVELGPPDEVAAAQQAVQQQAAFHSNTDVEVAAAATVIAAK